MTYKVQTRELEYCKLAITYIADPEEINDKRQKAIDFLRKGKIQGYRPGKAPDYAIKNKMSKQIDNWTQTELTKDAYDKILFETKIKPIGQPVIDSYQLHDNEFWCEYIVFVKPEFELKQYKNFEIPKPHSDNDVSKIAHKIIHDLRIQHGTLRPFEETDIVEQYDQVIIDSFAKTVDGNDIDLLKIEGILLKVGENPLSNNNATEKYNQLVSDTLLGMKLGEERRFSIDYEEIFIKPVPSLTLEGKIVFTIILHGGNKIELAPLDDSLAEKVGFPGYEEMEKTVKSAAVGQSKLMENQATDQQIVSRILSNHDFEIPLWLLHAELQQLLHQSNLNIQELSHEQREQLSETAKKNVKLALIFEKIREEEPETVFSNNEIIDILRQRLAERMEQGDHSLKKELEKLKSIIKLPNGKIICHKPRAVGATTINAIDYLLEMYSKEGKLVPTISAIRNEILMKWLREHSKVVE